MPKLCRLERAADRTPEERAAEKTRLLREFLPAVGFVDVSSRFGAAAGTVRFLGADVHYQGEQILSGENTVNALQELRLCCDEHGYAAIVFDSGAGVQSSADALHSMSDLLVYCMRPTRQFRQGSRTQLANYGERLAGLKAEREAAEDAKVVVLLPTAVPMTGENDRFSKRAFEEIRAIATSYEDIVDATFCTRETALNEVALFKWEECILNAEDIVGNEDEERAFAVYRRLAEVMVNNTKDE